MTYFEQELNLPGESTIRFAVMTTVELSIFVHGLSAMPGISVYERQVVQLAPGAPERQPFQG